MIPSSLKRLAAASGVAALAAAVLTTTTQSAVPVPLTMQPLAGSRTAIVVKHQPRSRTIAVATPSGRLMTIHALRPTKIGTRVQIGGIKWGATVVGVDWGRDPGGIKWGIKWARNGTYSAKLRKVGVAKRVRIRGIVVARNQRAVAIGAPGAVVIVRMAVWLPPGTKSLHAGALPNVGNVVSVTLPMAADGTMGQATGKVDSTGPRHIPVAGTITGIANANRTITLNISSDPVLPIVMTIPVPPAVDLAARSVGEEVTASVALDADGSLVLKALGPATGIAAANDPSQQYVEPAPGTTTTTTTTTPTTPTTPAWTADAAVFAAIDATIAELAAAQTAGDILDSTLGANLATKIQAVRSAAVAGDRTLALAQLDSFVADIEAAFPVGFRNPGSSQTRARAQSARREITR